MVEMKLDLLVNDIKDTVHSYTNVRGIVLQAQVDEEGHIDQVGMFLTFDDAHQMSLYGTFEVFDFNLDGLQALYDEVVIEFASLDVNLIVG